MIRAFIAVDIPQEIRLAIREAQTRLQRVRLGVKVSWAKVENVHLTLQFLGPIEGDVVPKISAVLEDVARQNAAFDLSVRGAGAFPDARRPRVLWVGCADAAGKLKELASAVQGAMQSLGFEPDHREFSAHLTLGRIKVPRPDDALTLALDSLKDNAFGTMRVDGIHLFQSQLHPEGSIYSKLSSHQLTGHHP